jgi:hypothetical protein
MFNSNQAYPIGVKVEINPKCFTLRVKVEIEKKNSIDPKLLINVKPSNLGSQLATLGAIGLAFINILASMFVAFTSNLGPKMKPKCSKLAPSLFGPNS